MEKSEFDNKIKKIEFLNMGTPENKSSVNHFEFASVVRESRIKKELQDVIIIINICRQ